MGALTRPQSESCFRVHSLARFMFGEPVRRGPIESISWLAVSMTLELRTPSWRMAVTISRSTRSSAGRRGAAATEQSRTAAKTLRKADPPQAFLASKVPRASRQSAVNSRQLTVDSGSKRQKRSRNENDYSLSAARDSIDRRLTAVLDEEQGQRELRRRVDPLLDGAEARRGPHRVDPLRGVLVGALGPDRLAPLEAHDEIRPRDRDFLRAKRDQVHLDAALLRVPDRPVLEGGEVEIGVELDVGAREK